MIPMDHQKIQSDAKLAKLIDDLEMMGNCFFDGYRAPDWTQPTRFRRPRGKS